MKIEEAKLFYTGEMDFRMAKVRDVLNPHLRVEIIEVSSNLRGPKCRVYGTSEGGPEGVISVYRWGQLEFVR